MLLDDLPRGVSRRAENLDKTPAARWREPEDITNDPALSFEPDAPGGKLFLGEVEGCLIGTPPDEDRHMITVAGSRAGKGISAIVPNLLSYKGSVLAIDPKGELACLTAQRRQRGLGQTVHILDPFDRLANVPWAAGYKGAYNPLTILKNGKDLSESAIEDAGLIADALVMPGEGGGDVHWDDAAQNFIEGLILHVATYSAYSGRDNLLTVRELLMVGTEHEDLNEPEPDKRPKKGMDGLCLQMQKNAHGRVWLNPPYGSHTSLWVERVVTAYNAGVIEQAVLLLKPAVGSQWYQSLAARFPECRLHRRIRFINKDGIEQTSPPHGNSFFYLGPDPAAFHIVFGAFGNVSVPYDGSFNLTKP